MKAKAKAKASGAATKAKAKSSGRARAASAKAKAKASDSAAQGEAKASGPAEAVSGDASRTAAQPLNGHKDEGGAAGLEEEERHPPLRRSRSMATKTMATRLARRISTASPWSSGLPRRA